MNAATYRGISYRSSGDDAIPFPEVIATGIRQDAPNEELQMGIENRNVLRIPISKYFPSFEISRTKLWRSVRNQIYE